MLIETKLQAPSMRSTLVERTELMAELDAVMESRIAVVAAPAGFGKSTLIGQWVKARQAEGLAVGWLSIDSQDDDLSRFLSYLVAAINRADPAIGDDLLALMHSSPVVPFDTVMTGLANSLAARKGHLILVLDDCHLLHNSEICRFLDGFVAYAPSTFHLVLATRGHVPLKVANMRVRGHLIRLDDTNLRFSLGETENFLNGAMALGLSSEDIVFLQHRTEGWIAGLQLASLSLHRDEGRAEFIRRFSGTDRDVADFLMQDVLARLPDNVLSFLLQTSILERFNANLANSVTSGSDAAAMIDHIEASNLFLISLDRDREWYRYHHLFSDLLRALLARQYPDKLPGLHRLAAKCLSEAGLTPDAVQHALAAGDTDLAANLVEQCCMPLIMQSHITRVSEWLSSLPDEIISQRPRLQLAQVWILFHMSRAKEAAAVLRKARDSISALEKNGQLSEGDRTELKAELYALTAGVISAADRSELAARLARRWLPEISESQHFCKGTLGNVLGFCYLSLGNLEDARIVCLKARDSHQQVNSVFGVVYSDLILGLTEKAAGNLKIAYQHFSRATRHARTELGKGSYAEAMVGIFEVEILYEWNEIDAAQKLLLQHRQIIEECGLVVHEMTCKLHVARLAAAANRHDEALSVLERAERQGLQTRYRRLFAIAIHERVRLLLLRGDVHAARFILKARGIDEAWLASPVAQRPASEPEHVAFARVLIADGHPEQALRILAPVADRIRKDGRFRRLAQVRTMMAIAAFRSGDGLAALDAIADAISMSAPGGALRSLMDEGHALQEVLQLGLKRIPSFQPNGPYHGFVNLLLDEEPAIQWEMPKPDGVRRPPQLSNRELEVARLLCSGRSNRDIGETLSMSTDTVKWHLKNIFGKLSVTNRTEAVLRLQHLGLNLSNRAVPSVLSHMPAAE